MFHFIIYFEGCLKNIKTTLALCLISILEFKGKKLQMAAAEFIP